MIKSLDLSLYSFREIAKVLQQLTEEQFLALGEGRARLELHFDDAVVKAPIKRPSTRSAKPTASAGQQPTPTAAAAAIRQMNSSEDVMAYLNKNDRALTKPKIIELAALLGPTVSVRSSGTKSQMFSDIVSGTVGFREESEVMLPGGFR